jgi:hypothetical protein
MRFRSSAVFLYLPPVFATLVLSGAWNYLSYGFMIGRQYYFEIWSAWDIVMLTLSLGFLPAQIAGISLLVIHRKTQGATQHGFVIYIWATTITFFAICAAHYLYWRQIRSLCCGTTW